MLLKLHWKSSKLIISTTVQVVAKPWGGGVFNPVYTKIVKSTIPILSIRGYDDFKIIYLIINITYLINIMQEFYNL